MQRRNSGSPRKPSAGTTPASTPQRNQFDSLRAFAGQPKAQVRHAVPSQTLRSTVPTAALVQSDEHGQPSATHAPASAVEASTQPSLCDCGCLSHPGRLCTAVQVAVAEMGMESGREVVVYKIRVADARGEWTVSRRFRSFEALHRTLREQLGPTLYILKLPAKRIFAASQGVQFVEERRMQLNSYLAQIVADPGLYGVCAHLTGNHMSSMIWSEALHDGCNDPQVAA